MAALRRRGGGRATYKETDGEDNEESALAAAVGEAGGGGGGKGKGHDVNDTRPDCQKGLDDRHEAKGVEDAGAHYNV